MGSLCYYLDPPGIMALCAGPIYLLSEPVDYSPGTEIVFEILAADAHASVVTPKPAIEGHFKTGHGAAART